MKKYLLAATLALGGLAFGFNLDWFTIDGGGGTSAGGSYLVSGTIGQTDTDTLSGGVYRLTGGFWAAPEVLQTPGGPPLAIAYNGGPSAVLSWPAPSTGWQLQKSDDLKIWTPVTLPVVVQGGANTVTSPVIPGREFYRLLKP